MSKYISTCMLRRIAYLTPALNQLLVLILYLLFASKNCELLSDEGYDQLSNAVPGEEVIDLVRRRKAENITEQDSSRSRLFATCGAS
jgi:hypothetical protein